MRSDRERLLDILDAAERIGRYVAHGRQRFDTDELVQNWIVHHLEIVEEACAGLSEEIRSQHAEIPWRGYIGMRNILVHQYFGIDLEPVWLAATQELGELVRTIESFLSEVSGE